MYTRVGNKKSRRAAAGAMVTIDIWLAALSLAVSTAAVAVPSLPSGINKQLPAGYAVLSSARMSVTRPARIFYIVALRRNDEPDRTRSGIAPARPLVIFEQRKDAFMLAGRNDTVVLLANEGGQCDPFLDGEATISVKGRFFTVENGVACGQHWTNYITFRFVDRKGFVFDNERSESWSINASSDPKAEALVRNGPQQIVRSQPGRAVLFTKWHRRR